jgi:predicted component of type VI protein secretion system
VELIPVFIQIHTDNQVASDDQRDSRLEEQIRQRLARFEGRITTSRCMFRTSTARAAAQRTFVRPWRHG